MFKKQKTHHYSNAAFAFFYCLSLVALIMTATSVGAVFFQLINKYVKDIIDYRSTMDMNAVKMAIATIIIAGPVYFYTSYKIHKALFLGHLTNQSGIRRWLSYFILFISAVIIIGYLIGILFSFLDGELTTKFLLKALTAIIISGMAFGFYLYDVKREKVKGVKDKIIRGFCYISIALAVIALIIAFFLVEPPRISRMRKIDDNNISRLQTIQSSVQNYYDIKGVLPADLEEAVKSSTWARDEEMYQQDSQEEFEYNIVNAKKYQLCANFNLSSFDEQGEPVEPYRDKLWDHQAGQQCFDLEVYDREIKEESLRRLEPEPIPAVDRN